MKEESKFWQLVKRKTPQIQWTRLESWSSYGVPDLLGYNENCGFFMVELKIQNGKKIHFSPHQRMFHLTRTNRNFILVHEPRTKTTMLYPSSAIHDLQLGAARCLALDDWDHNHRLLLAAPCNA